MKEGKQLFPDAAPGTDGIYLGADRPGGGDIYAGCLAMRPVCGGGDNACAYCAYHSICRFDEAHAANRRRWKEPLKKAGGFGTNRERRRGTMAKMRLTGRQQEAVSTGERTFSFPRRRARARPAFWPGASSRLLRKGRISGGCWSAPLPTWRPPRCGARIGRELLARAEETKNARLAAQAEYVQLADICTIHKFAIKVVRENAAVWASRQRSGWEARRNPPSSGTRPWRMRLQSFMRPRTQIFWHFGINMRGGRTKALKAQILSLYAFCSSRPEGLEWLRHAAEADGVPALFGSHPGGELAAAEQAGGRHGGMLPAGRGK